VGALNTYGVVFGVVIAVLSAGASFFNKQRYEGQIALLQAGNDELRGQNADLRAERTDIKADLAACAARADEREKLLDEYKRQPKFAAVIKMLKDNHTEVMTMLGKIISDGK
jgi:hypothetical protein